MSAIPSYEREINDLKIEIGNVITGEEDYILLADKIYGVADGVGSLKGAKASKIAIDTAYNHLKDYINGALPKGSNMDYAIRLANEEVRKEAPGEGTTITIVHVCESKTDPEEQEIWGAYIGDSPAYIFYENGSFEKLTEEQNIATDYFGKTDPNLVEALDYYNGTLESIAHLNLTTEQKTWLIEGAPLPLTITRERFRELIDILSVPLTEDEASFLIKKEVEKTALTQHKETHHIDEKIEEKLNIWQKNTQMGAKQIIEWEKKKEGITEEEIDYINEIREKCDHLKVLKKGLFETRNIITEMVGEETINIKTFSKKGNFKGAQILIMSDGITDNLTPLELKELLIRTKYKSTQEKAEYIHKASQGRSKSTVNLRAKPDDMAIVIIEIK